MGYRYGSVNEVFSKETQRLTFCPQAKARIKNVVPIIPVMERQKWDEKGNRSQWPVSLVESMNSWFKERQLWLILVVGLSSSGIDQNTWCWVLRWGINFYQIIWSMRTQPKSGWHLIEEVQIKGYRKKETLLFACLPELSLVIYLSDSWNISSPVLEWISLGIPM